MWNLLWHLYGQHTPNLRCLGQTSANRNIFSSTQLFWQQHSNGHCKLSFMEMIADVSHVRLTWCRSCQTCLMSVMSDLSVLLEKLAATVNIKTWISMFILILLIISFLQGMGKRVMGEPCERIFKGFFVAMMSYLIILKSENTFPLRRLSESKF